MKKIDGRLDLDNYIKDCCNLIIGDEDQALFHIRCKESTGTTAEHVADFCF